MSSPRIVELERQLAMIERSIDAAAGDRVSEAWIAISIGSRNRPSHELWGNWLMETGLAHDELKVWFHRLPTDIVLVSTPNFDGDLGGDWRLVEIPSRVTAGPAAHSWFHAGLNRLYRQWQQGLL